MLPERIREYLPASLKNRELDASMALSRGLEGIAGDSCLVVVDGRLLLLTRGASFEPFEEIELSGVPVLKSEGFESMLQMESPTRGTLQLPVSMLEKDDLSAFLEGLDGLLSGAKEPASSREDVVAEEVPAASAPPASVASPTLPAEPMPVEQATADEVKGGDSSKDSEGEEPKRARRKAEKARTKSSTRSKIGRTRYQEEEEKVGRTRYQEEEEEEEDPSLWDLTLFRWLKSGKSTVRLVLSALAGIIVYNMVDVIVLGLIVAYVVWSNLGGWLSDDDLEDVDLRSLSRCPICFEDAFEPDPEAFQDLLTRGREPGELGELKRCRACGYREAVEFLEDGEAITKAFRELAEEKEFYDEAMSGCEHVLDGDNVLTREKLLSSLLVGMMLELRELFWEKVFNEELDEEEFFSMLRELPAMRELVRNRRDLLRTWLKDEDEFPYEVEDCPEEFLALTDEELRETYDIAQRKSVLLKKEMDAMMSSLFA